ncbi:small ribosomal subunit protein uS9m-like [Amphiura filiformis]|uniref:small ribosomal subunit protein uS9m-like n=1 Tax=Amphiura filiformis TaxID=82378 RepID=UPI003B20B987
MAATMRRFVLLYWRRKTGVFPALPASTNPMVQHSRCCSSANPDESSPINQKSAIMAAAEERRKKFDTLIQSEREAYDRGKRHLANMMGEDPTTFTQADVDRALAYLLPSGITDKRARPVMKPPEEYYPPMKAGQHGPDGRPLHFLFYTRNPQYYELMHNTYSELLKVVHIERRKIAAGILESDMEAIDLARSEWINKDELEQRCIEGISEEQYSRFLALLERITQQPYAKEAEEYVWQFRNKMQAISKREKQPIQYDESGRGFAFGKGMKKSARASVIIRDQGSGKVVVNNTSFVKFFPELQNRVQILFPFNFVNMVNRFDVEATVEGGGHTGQATAIRHGISLALSNHFVDEHTVEQMRQAGLLTRDPRIRERKKPGRKGARAKFPWKAR